MIGMAKQDRPGNEANSIEKWVGKKIQGHVVTKLMKWDPIVRESEEQIIEMIRMCDENHMANMLNETCRPSRTSSLI